MKRFLRRTIGLLLIGAGVVGLIISLAGLFIGLPALSAVEETVKSRVADLDQALITAADGLTVADTSLASATETITAIETTIRSSGQAISDTLPTIDRVGAVVGIEMPRAIRSTQQTLESARETARVADALLGAISRIGLLGADAYNPDVPLNQAIQQVADSLDPLPASLSNVRDRLTVTGATCGESAPTPKQSPQTLQQLTTISATHARSSTVIKHWWPICKLTLRHCAQRCPSGSAWRERCWRSCRSGLPWRRSPSLPKVWHCCASHRFSLPKSRSSSRSRASCASAAGTYTFTMLREPCSRP